MRGGVPDEHCSITLLKASKSNLITREIAHDLAAALIRERWGEEELQQQSPLEVSDAGDSWEVVGSRFVPPGVTAELQPKPGRIMIEIAKQDCRILKFYQESHWPMITPDDLRSKP